MSYPGELSDDARVIVLLCSSVASARGESAKPLGPAAWARVQNRLAELGAVPADVLRAGPSGPGVLGELLGGLDIDLEAVGRQLARSGQLAFELDRLGSRGIAVVTLADEAYPARLRDRLGSKAPPVLFTSGDASILDAGGVAIVGSRDIDAPGAEFAAAMAASTARDGRVVVSGGARGVDQIAMRAALEAGGRVAGLLPEGLERRLREPETRSAITDGLVALASPYHPSAGFTAGAAMGRNKLIYALADAAVVVASAVESGGTWAGAVEALRGGWVPVFVRAGSDVPEGNRRLIVDGAIPIEAPDVAGLVVPARALASPTFEQGTLDL